MIVTVCFCFTMLLLPSCLTVTYTPYCTISMHEYNNVLVRMCTDTSKQEPHEQDKKS